MTLPSLLELFFKLKNKKARSVFIIMIVSLHAAFLGLARL